MPKIFLQIKMGAGLISRSHFLFWIQTRVAGFIAACLSLALISCSIAVTRPQQEMSDSAAAIKAAREVNAETLSPDLYRQANEAFFRARNEFRLKNYDLAKTYAEKAKIFAERAEFEAMQSGAPRTSTGIPDAPPPPPPEPYEYPVPTGTPANPSLQGSAPAGPNSSPTSTP